MPYFFAEIEKEKTFTIKWMMVFLFLIYFLLIFIPYTVIIFVILWLNQPLGTPFVLSDWIKFSLEGIPYIAMVVLLITVFHWEFVANRLSERIRKLLRALPTPGLDLKTKEFYNIIQELKIASGERNRIFGLIIPSVSLNSFSFTDREENHFIGVTQGMLDRFSRAQIESVIAHEAAHIFIGDNLDRTMASVTFGFFTKVSNETKDVILPDFDDQEENPFDIFFAIPKGLTRLMAMFIAREREARADVVATKLTRDPLSLAESLYLIDRFSPEDKLISEIFEALFIVSPRKNRLDKEKGFWANLFSTHPPIQERIEVLLKMGHEDLRTMEERLFKKP